MVVQLLPQLVFHLRAQRMPVNILIIIHAQLDQSQHAHQPQQRRRNPLRRRPERRIGNVLGKQRLHQLVEAFAVIQRNAAILVHVQAQALAAAFLLKGYFHQLQRI